MPFSIVCTHDALVGKKWLMRNIGCIPTKKFVSDVSLISDMKNMLKKKKVSEQNSYKCEDTSILGEVFEINETSSIF